MAVGATVAVLPLLQAEAACREAEVKWNPPRLKRSGQQGTVSSVDEATGKVKVTFEDAVTVGDKVIRTDTQTLLFPAAALGAISTDFGLCSPDFGPRSPEFGPYCWTRAGASTWGKHRERTTSWAGAASSCGEPRGSPGVLI